MLHELEPQTIKKILNLKKTGMNNAEIARIIGCNRDSVRKYVTLYQDQLDLDVRTTPEKIKELWDQGCKPGEIAEKLNLSGSCVRANVVKMGLRPKREYHPNQEYIHDIEMPPLKVKPETDIFYPDRIYKSKRYQDRGKKYFDVSEVYGL